MDTQKKIKLKTQFKGFGIIEVMVAIAIVGVLAVGITSLMTGAMKQQKGIQAKDQQRDITAEIRSLLGNKAACLSSFGGQNPQTGFTTATMNDALGVAKYSVGTNDKTGMLTFTEFRINNWVVDAVVPTQGTADLAVKLQKVGDTGTAKDIRPDIITLKIKRNLAGNIIECFSMGNGSDSLWQVSPTNLSNIHYSGGNVGIENNDPKVKLDVAGGVRTGSETEVVACGLGKNNGEGTQRYNYTLHKYEYCNGTIWAEMGGGPAGAFGGMYELSTFTGYSCRYPNPITGSCTCPAGYTTMLSGQAFRWSKWDSTILICFKP